MQRGVYIVIILIEFDENLEINNINLFYSLENLS